MEKVFLLMEQVNLGIQGEPKRRSSPLGEAM